MNSRLFKNWTKNTWMGLVVVLSLIGWLVLTGVPQAHEIGTAIKDGILHVAKLIEKPSPGPKPPEPICKPEVVTVYYRSEAGGSVKEDPWKACLDTETFKQTATFSGYVENQGKARGSVHGYYRDGTRVLVYGSENPDRPGFGTYILRAAHPEVIGDPMSYVGIAVVHACNPGGNKPLCSGPVIICPAIMSERGQVPEHLKELYAKEPCRRISMPNVSEEAEAYTQKLWPKTVADWPIHK